MYEVERKARTEHARVREALHEMGAEPAEHVRQRDTYFSHPVRDFAQTDEALRLRREQPSGDRISSTTRLTYKGPRLDGDSKTRLEIEVDVGAGEALRDILEAVGFTPVETVAKRREYYRYDDLRICLDTVTGLGEFVEVEAECDVNAVDETSEMIGELFGRLGIDPADELSQTYLELLLDA